MNLGAFSISLSVNDLAASQRFYETLGFAPAGGDAEQGWLILRSGEQVIGLFQGMFERNMLTFNPGWDQHGEDLPSFEDVRTLQHRFESAGLSIVNPTDARETGPGSFLVIDPDGNPILFDQHR